MLDVNAFETVKIFWSDNNYFCRKNEEMFSMITYVFQLVNRLAKNFCEYKSFSIFSQNVAEEGEPTFLTSFGI